MKEKYINGFRSIFSIVKRHIIVIMLLFLLASFCVSASIEINKDNGQPLGDGTWKYTFNLNPLETAEIFIPPSLSLISTNSEPMQFERVIDSYLWGFIKVDKGTKLVFGPSQTGGEVILIYGPTQSFVAIKSFSIF